MSKTSRGDWSLTVLPSVSVVMLCYNHEKYVRVAIESILTQSFSDLELIVVDDGSTDSSVSVMRGFADSRLKIIEKKNGGPSDAFTTGVTAARAPLIALMSADDVAHPDRLKIQIDEIEQHAAGVTFCRPALVGEDGEPLPDSTWPVFFRWSFATQTDLYRTLFHKGNFICAPSVMFRAPLFTRFGSMHNALLQLQDFSWWVRLAPHMPFHCSEHRYLSYRIRSQDGNLSSTANNWRTKFEKALVYRDFFIGADRQFLNGIFGEAIHLDSGDLVFEAQKARLLLSHEDPVIQLVGAERLIDLMQTQEQTHVLRDELGLHLRDVYDQAAKATAKIAAKSKERRSSKHRSRFLRLARLFAGSKGK
jgi:glycosyltransferase involved in cell wall biosynthesis